MSQHLPGILFGVLLGLFTKDMVNIYLQKDRKEKCVNTIIKDYEDKSMTTIEEQFESPSVIYSDSSSSSSDNTLLSLLNIRESVSTSEEPITSDEETITDSGRSSDMYIKTIEPDSDEDTPFNIRV